MLNEINQTQKDKYYMIPFHEVCKTVQLIEPEGLNDSCQEQLEGKMRGIKSQ